MLLQSLLAAIASGARRGPRKQSAGVPGTKFKNEGFLAFDAPFQEIAKKLAPDELWDAFAALPDVEQLKIIEAELLALGDADRKRIIGLLGRELNRPWLPLPGPQTTAFTTQADILFYGGGAGSGKSSLLCGTSLTEHHIVRLFRRESVQVRGLVDELQKILKSRIGYNDQSKIWRVPGSETVIEFAHCQHEDDKEKYQGRAADLIGFDEITHFSESQFRYLIGWNRPLDGSKAKRSRVIVTGNPPEHADGRWVVSYWGAWLDPSHPRPAKDGELRWYTTIAGEDREVDGPGPHGTDELDQPIMARSRTFIRGLLKDNPYLLEAGYAATLQSHPEPLRSMLLEGRFDLPVEDDSWQVIPTSWVAAAQARWTPDPPAGALMTCIGVDVAQGGPDETVLAPRRGNWFAPIKAVKGIDTKDGSAVAGLVFAVMRDGCEIAIDVGGGWGADAHGHLKQQQIKSVPVNWVETTSETIRGGTLKFFNKRAQYWWRFREALDPNGAERIALPPDKTLAADLATPRWHRRRSQDGEIQVEDKADIRKRLRRSPDRGDAVVMCWAHGGLAIAERAGRSLQTHANVAHAAAKGFQTQSYGSRSLPTRSARR